MDLIELVKGFLTGLSFTQIWQAFVTGWILYKIADAVIFSFLSKPESQYKKAIAKLRFWINFAYNWLINNGFKIIEVAVLWLDDNVIDKIKAKLPKVAQELDSDLASIIDLIIVRNNEMNAKLNTLKQRIKD